MPTIYGNERRQTKNDQEQPSNASRHLCCLWNEKVKVYKRQRKRLLERHNQQSPSWNAPSRSQLHRAWHEIAQTFEPWFDSKRVVKTHQQSWQSCSSWHLLCEKQRYENAKWKVWHQNAGRAWWNFQPHASRKNGTRSCFQNHRSKETFRMGVKKPTQFQV